MERARRVTQVWSWLPAFRAVAETQHLPTASKEVNLSASALSRAVRLLEDHLEEKLFLREGRHLALSPAGRVLLTAIRDAMRRVDDGLAAVADSTMKGPVAISAAGPYASIFVLPALQALTEDYPDIVPAVGSVELERIYPRLLDGSLDLALLEDPQLDDSLTIHLLGKLTHGLYAASDHPLARSEKITVDDVLRHPFVVPPKGLTDHFPAHLERRVALVVGQLHVGVQACATGNLLAFLPDAVAFAYRGDGALVRLPLEPIPPRPLYAVHRRVHSTPNRTLAVRHAIEAAVRNASQRSRPGSVQPPAEDGVWA